MQEEFIPVTEQMLKEMYEKSQKRKKKPSTKIKQLTDNIWLIETKKKRK